jgi:hypothetical protein
MSGPVMRKIEVLLREGESMTISEMVDALGCSHASVWYACKRHPLVYIDRWTVCEKGPAMQWVAAYSIADKPADTPKPSIKPGAYMRQRGAA